MTECEEGKRVSQESSPNGIDLIAPAEIRLSELGGRMVTGTDREHISDENLAPSSAKNEEDHFPDCIRCRSCDRRFSHLSRLRQHELTHRAGKLFSCSHCSKEFSRRDTLARHETIHEEKELVSCEVDGCGIKFRSERYLRAHVEIHFVNKKFECSQCTSLFRSRKHLVIHLGSHKNLEERQLGCDICGMRALKSNMKRHKQTCHPTAASKPKCEICDLKVRDHAQLREHRKRCHSNTVETFNCSVCEKELRSAYGLAKHKRTHRPERTHECSDCGKSFLRKDTLEIHRRVHSNIRPYDCKSCDASFTQKGHLSRHENRFH